MYSILIFLDVDKLPADSLAKVAAYDVDKLFSKTSTISEGAISSHLSFCIKGMRPRIFRHPSRRCPAATFDEGKGSIGYSFFLSVDFHPFHDLIHLSSMFFLVYFQGLTLLELAAHLEGQAAKLRHEGLEKVKIALAGTNTSFLLDILEGCFGHKDLDTSQSTISHEETETGATIDDVASNIPKKTPPTLPAGCGAAAAELVFPLISVPTVIAGIPEPFLPVHGLETLSQYHCQHPSCTLEFSQKAAACNHV